MPHKKPQHMKKKVFQLTEMKLVIFLLTHPETTNSEIIGKSPQQIGRSYLDASQL